MFPRIVMFYGGALGERRYLTDLEEIMCFGAAIAKPTTTRDAVADRRYVEVARYWHHSTWEPYLADTTLLSDLPLPSVPWSGLPLTSTLQGLDPVARRQHLVEPARLYLGDDQHPPLFDYLSADPNALLALVEPDGLQILERHAVPVRTVGARTASANNDERALTSCELALRGAQGPRGAN
jgi:hypothetical protein